MHLPVPNRVRRSDPPSGSAGCKGWTSADRQRAALAAVGIGTWFADLGARRVLCDPVLSGLLGLGPVETSLTFEALADHIDHASQLRLAAAAATGAIDLELRVRLSSDGAERRVHIRGAEAPQATKGVLAGTLQFVPDLPGAPPEVDRMPSDSDERLLLALDASGDGTWDWNVATGQIFFSERWLDRLGSRPLEAPWQFDWSKSAIHPDDRPRVRKLLADHLRGDIERFECEMRLRTKTGGWRWVLNRGRVVARDPASGAALRMVGTSEDISQRKAVEEALRVSEALNRSIVESSPDCIKLLDLQGNLLFINSRGTHAMGFPSIEPLRRRPWTSWWPEESQPSVRAAIQSAREGNVARFVGPVVTADGQRKWWDNLITPIRGADGRNETLLVISRDITKQREAEAELQESRRRLATMIDNLPGMAYRSAPSAPWPFVYVSEGVAALTGYAAADFIEARMSWAALMDADDRRRLELEIAEAIARRQPLSTSYRIRHRSGETRWVLERGQPVFNEAGELLLIEGFIGDLTEQKHVEEALRQAEERYRLAAKASDDAIWDWDVQRDQCFWNEAVATHFGYDPAAIRESVCWWEQHVHPDDRDRVVSGLRRAVEGQDSRWTDEYRFMRADGSYAEVYDRGFLIRDSEGRAVRMVGMMVDMTERKRAEAQLKQVQAELIHVSRLSAMGAMASTLAHELNQPLTAVTNYVKGGKRLIATRGAEALPELDEALEGAGAQALRAGQIVRRLRELVARGDVEKRVERLDKLIEEASALALIGTQEAGVRTRVELDPACDHVLVDRIQIQQVLLNLIRNAVEAMADSDRRELVLATRPRGRGMVEVSVTDTGPGVSPAIRRTLFTPFVSTKDQGMGVGLSICRTIVEAHGGQLWVEDAPTGGAAFHFTLPQARKS